MYALRGRQSLVPNIVPKGNRRPDGLLEREGQHGLFYGRAIPANHITNQVHLLVVTRPVYDNEIPWGEDNCGAHTTSMRGRSFPEKWHVGR